MDFEFSADQEMLRDTVRRFLADRAPISYVRGMIDDPRGTTDEVWRGLAALGVTGILVPEAHGGLGLGMVDMGVVLEEMGRAVHPGPFLSSAVAATAFADDALLPALAAGTTIATVALFEPGRRHDATSPATTAARDGDGWSVTGAKTAVMDAAAADVILVTATADGATAVFSADADAAGLTIEPRATVDGTRKEFDVRFDTVAARRVEREVDLTAAVDRIVAALVVDGVGAASAALDLTLDYAKEREQFGVPIGSFQAIQHLCADMLRDLELARAGAYYALWACDDADATTRHEAATMAKAWAGDALARVGAASIQVHGGIGFTWEHDAHLFYKRLLTLQHAFGGTGEHIEELARLIYD